MAGRAVAGRWNFDQGNRESFGKEGPARIKVPRSFRPDESTEAVLKLLNERSRNRDKLEENHRMRMQYQNLDRIDSSERKKIRARVPHIKEGFHPEDVSC